MSTPLKIVFAGTPDFAAQTLAALVASKHEVIAVYTQPDRRAGRGKQLTASPVKKLALENDIEVYQPIHFKDDSDLQTLSSLNADIMVVVAYGIILPQSVLDIPEFGCLNVHASLLPRWRGAAPIERSLLAGDLVTGVTIMQMDKGLDTGDMLNSISIPITPDLTSGALHDLLIPAGSESLLTTLDQVSSNQLTPVVQDESLACYAQKLTKQEGLIDWANTAESISIKIRGLTPRPVAFSSVSDETVRIWHAIAAEIPSTEILTLDQYIPGTIIAANKHGIDVCCGKKTILTILKVQLAGGKQLEAHQVVNSKKETFQVGNVFSSLGNEL